MIRALPVTAAALLLALLAACSDTIHGVEFAEPAVAEVRARLQRHEFEQIYDTSSKMFRDATPRDKGVALFAAVDRKLGALKHTKQMGWSVNTRNGVTIATLGYDSEYERGHATETFTIEVDDGKGKLAGYNIQSLEMMIY